MDDSGLWLSSRRLYAVEAWIWRNVRHLGSAGLSHIVLALGLLDDDQLTQPIHLDDAIRTLDYC